MLIGASTSDLLLGGVIVLLSVVLAGGTYRFRARLGVFFEGRSAGGASARDVERFFVAFAIVSICIGLYTVVYLVLA